MKMAVFLHNHPIFRSEEFAEAKRSNKQSTHTLANGSNEQLLKYHVQQGHIVRVRNGVYWTVPPGTNADACAIDPVLVAAKLTDDAIIAYHAALEVHGLAYSAWNKFTYLTNHKKAKPLNFRGSLYQPVIQPIALRSEKLTSWGIETRDRLGIDIQVTSLERTMVDVLDRADLSGGWEEIWRSLETISYLKFDLLLEYILLLKNASTVAKLGFFLEQHKDQFGIADSELGKLHKHQPLKTQHMQRSAKEQILIKEWNLYVPKEVVERSWEEF